ncbi:cyclic pyranopterin monophosphate synthase MoaC [Acaryochloris sp. IP29b_bin.148]|uniref:cyclic pyranopterin monophosphate synthase MoaC n=1 Tax=Acaryochloris sp. IP29b_bin.148 TaxID=2969218 RepID=UPI00260F3D0F|nr:cyclic pyranopterin monophosphate synthase MoaC [Acaryochloris sp. IP29b_bin.148]
MSNQHSGLTHLDPQGEAQMVDISNKSATVREATAVGQVRMHSDTFTAIQAGNASKGDVLGVARLAGIMAAKQTANLIPLCHPLPMSKIEVVIQPQSALPGYRIEATVKTQAATGVEMEALTAVSISALTLYDMAKALDKSISIDHIHLVKKMGGKSGHWQAEISGE